MNIIHTENSVVPMPCSENFSRPSVSHDIADLQQRLRESEARCAALQELLCAGGIDFAPLRSDAGTARLADILEERRLDYPETSPLGRRRFESFGRRLLDATGPDALLRDVAGSHIEALLASCMHPCTYNGMRASARAFFQWCIRRRLLRGSPVDGIDPRPEPRHEPRFYTPEQVRRVFRAATTRDTDPAIGVTLALGFLCGMRTSEISRAHARDINYADGTVRVPIPKGYFRGTPPRLIQARPSALAWLRYFLPPDIAPDTPIAASAHVFREWKRTRLAPIGLDWGHDAFRNVMRHTACTMHVAAFRDLAETQLMLGHASGSAVTIRHYLGLASRSMGEEYWAIMPPRGRHPNARAFAASRVRAVPRDPRFLTILLDATGAPLSRGPDRATIRPDGSVDFGSDAMDV